MLLPRDFYTREDVVQLAHDLLGKKLCTLIDGKVCSGIISETEAYAGVTDRASHAFGGRRTTRTEIMYRVGGTAYVYLCYGIHSLFNIVTNKEDIPHAILVRSIIPDDNLPEMEKRFGRKLSPASGAGPGNVSKLLGIHYSHTGMDLCRKPGRNSVQDTIWLEDEGIHVPESEIRVTTRVGVDYAGEDALLPYRFIWQKNR